MPQPAHNLFNTHRTLENEGFACSYYSLPALAEAGIGSTPTLPVRSPYPTRIIIAALRWTPNYRSGYCQFGKLGGACSKSLGDSF